MTNKSRAKRRMDTLVRHLTAEPADALLKDFESSGTPQKLELRRELASAQKERVKREYGYDFGDEVNELQTQPASDIDDDVEAAKNRKKRVRFQARWEDEVNEENLDELSAMRNKLAKACRLAWTYEVAGSKTDEDSASLFVPGHGYLFKPLGVRFDEVTPDSLTFTTKRDDLPALHSEMYGTLKPDGTLCILSAAHSD